MSSPAIAQSPAPTVTVRPRPVEAVGRGRHGDVLLALGPHWTRIDRVPFGSTVDVEHVLLSTTGVFVVATESSVADCSLSHAISEVRWRARKIAFLLDRVGRPRVTPVLIVGGPGAPAIPGGYETVDGVLVCRRADAARWIAHLGAIPSMLDSRQINEMVDLLVDHTLRTDEINSRPTRRHVVPKS
jgi:hypothetical protein